MLHIAKTLLNGGEVSPLMFGRPDQPRYASGWNYGLNMVPLPQGPATRRPGTMFAGEAVAQGETAATRLVPFRYGAGNHRMLELYNGGMRVWNANGTLLRDEHGQEYSLALPYTDADLAGLCVAQSADVLFIASASHPPAKISRYGDFDWRYEVLAFAPKTPRPSQPTATAGGSNAGTGSQTYSYIVVAVNGDTGELSLPSDARDITTSSLSATWNIALTWPAVTGAGEYRVYKKKGGVYGFIGRAVEGALSFVDNNIGPDTGDVPPGNKQPFTGEGNYPSVVFFHQQRLGWAATRNHSLTLWLSQSANFENLSASIIPKDDDGIEATIAARNTQKILWVEPDGNALLIGLDTGETAMLPPTGSVLSPSAHGFEKQSDHGSAENLSALAASGGGVLFVQRGGNCVRMLSFDAYKEKHVAGDLSILSQHVLYDRHIRAWAWQALPHGIVWMALSDGSLVGLTLLTEHEVTGWHRHATPGFVEQVAVLPAHNDAQDMVWMVVRRTVGGVEQRYIEILAPWFFQNSPETAYFVDCGVSQWADGGQAFSTLNGLDHLEGMEVQVFADGYVMPARIVVGGAIALDAPVSVAHAGLGYAAEIEPTVPEFDLADGSTMGRLGRTANVKLHLYESYEAEVSVDGRKPVPWRGSMGLTRFSQRLEDMPGFVQHGYVDVSLGGGFCESRAIRITVSGPVPFTLLGFVAAVDISGSGKGKLV